MKQTLFAALLAALAASALTFLLAGLRPAAPPPAAPAVPGLAELAAEVAALRREMAIARTAVPASGPAPAPAPAPAVAVPAPEETPAAAADGPAPAGDIPEVEPAEGMPAVVEERSVIVRPAEAVERLHAVTRWEKDAEVRRYWMLASEEAVVSQFGKPDEVSVADGGMEYWIYRTKSGEVDDDGSPIWRDVTLHMSRGRLVQAYD
jgi:hypothetical protein